MKPVAVFSSRLDSSSSVSGSSGEITCSANGSDAMSEQWQELIVVVIVLTVAFLWRRY